MPDIVIVMPTYNERENLEKILPELLALPVEGLRVLVVDDNSPDGTGDYADDWAARDARVGVLHRQVKEGLGKAYIAGFTRALAEGADVIIQMDADYSHQPKYIPQLLVALNTADVVIGSRFAQGGSVDESWGWYRKLLSVWANRIYTPTILGLPINDSTGGFKAWKRETLIGMNIERVQSNGYVFQVEMNYVAHQLGYRLVEVPIHFPDRQIGESKMSSDVALEAARRVWELRAEYQHLNPSMRAIESQQPSSENE